MALGQLSVGSISSSDLEGMISLLAVIWKRENIGGSKGLRGRTVLLGKVIIPRLKWFCNLELSARLLP
jgi:hypothetical protein